MATICGPHKRKGAHDDLYKIPITRLRPASRIYMPEVPIFRLRQRARSIVMMDVVMLAIALAFFAVSIGYVYACDRM
jgi:hypothetical protein